MTSLTTEHIKKETTNIMGLFKVSRDLNAFLAELQDKGCSENEISLIMSQNTKNAFYSYRNEEAPEVTTDINNKAPEGFLAGAVTGGAIGAVIGGLTLTGSLLIPGSQVLLLGPAIGAIAGGAAGGTAGGLVGLLAGMGIPEIEAHFYKDAVDNEENILVVVKAPKDQEKVIKDVFKRYDPEKMA